MVEVIHIKKAPLNYKTSPHYQYIGRPTIFGNPVKISQPCPICSEIHYGAGDTLACYHKYFHDRIKRDPMFKKMVLALDGKYLVCYCKPAPCHGDIIADYINSGTQGELF